MPAHTHKRRFEGVSASRRGVEPTPHGRAHAATAHPHPDSTGNPEPTPKQSLTDRSGRRRSAGTDHRVAYRPHPSDAGRRSAPGSPHAWSPPTAARARPSSISPTGTPSPTPARPADASTTRPGSPAPPASSSGPPPRPPRAAATAGPGQTRTASRPSWATGSATTSPTRTFPRPCDPATDRASGSSLQGRPASSSRAGPSTRPTAANRVRLAWLLTACARLLHPSGCLILVVANTARGQRRRRGLLPRGHRGGHAGLSYLQHIVAVSADTDGDSFVYHLTHKELHTLAAHATNPARDARTGTRRPAGVQPRLRSHTPEPATAQPAASLEGR